MTEITLEFIAEQQRRILDEMRQLREGQSRMHDEMLVTGARAGYIEASMERIEAAIVLLTLEVRASRNQATRMDARLKALEDRVPL